MSSIKAFFFLVEDNLSSIGTGAAWRGAGGCLALEGHVAASQVTLILLPERTAWARCPRVRATGTAFPSNPLTCAETARLLEGHGS